MSLPLLCPKTDSGQCTGNKCQMYVKDWRSNEEYCIMVYYSISNRKIMGEPIIDNYAAKVKSTRKNSTKEAVSINMGSKFELQKPVKPKQQPTQATKKIKLKVNKTKKMMDLDDIPDDYEEQFWEKL